MSTSTSSVGGARFQTVITVYYSSDGMSVLTMRNVHIYIGGGFYSSVLPLQGGETCCHTRGWAAHTFTGAMSDSGERRQIILS